MNETEAKSHVVEDTTPEKAKEDGEKSDLVDSLIKNSIFGNIYKNDYFWTLNESGAKEVLKAKDFDIEIKSEVFYKEVVCEEEQLKPHDKATDGDEKPEATTATKP